MVVAKPLVMRIQGNDEQIGKLNFLDEILAVGSHARIFCRNGFDKRSAKTI